ncbi:hypothetical protein AB4Z55_20165 [Gordonia sp. ABKF26]|uniref:hypothetical protein n=1 Tax=Gordonia sp. ABKF26 TaxID=3238687 RepID=UPI0034E41E98
MSADDFNPDDDQWTRGYLAAADRVAGIPGPILPALLTRILDVAPDPTHDPDYDTGYRAALQDVISGHADRGVTVGGVLHLVPAVDLLRADDLSVTALCGENGRKAARPRATTRCTRCTRCYPT